MINRLFFVGFICVTLLGGCGDWGANGDNNSKLQSIDIVASPIVIIDGASTSTLAEGNTQSFIAMGHYADGSWRDVSDSVFWISNNVKVATMTFKGLLTGVAAGTTSVTANKDGITSNSVSVEVSSAVITAIHVTPTVVSVAKNQTQQLTAIATYSNGAAVDVTDSVTWVRPPIDSNVINLTPTGLLTGVAAGTIRVTASKDGITSNTVAVEVNSAFITTIQIISASVTVAKGQTRQLTAIGIYSNGTIANVSNSVTWIPADISVAAVAPTGLLVGVEAGTTSVTANKDNITSNMVSVVINLWVTIPGVGSFSIPDGVTRSWNDADVYCSNLSIGGRGWRLATKAELFTLYSTYPANQIDTVLGWPTVDGYWSSTPHFAGYHHYEDLSYGDISVNYDDYDYFVVCVR